MLNRQYHDHVLLHDNVHEHHVDYGFDVDDGNEPIHQQDNQLSSQQ